jgi:hypothetical protein
LSQILTGSTLWRKFFIWPVISITAIYFLASKTKLLSDDPILWFSMMLAPTGPPALILTAMADLAGANEDEKMGIAKFLTVGISHCMRHRRN